MTLKFLRPHSIPIFPHKYLNNYICELCYKYRFRKLSTDQMFHKLMMRIMFMEEVDLLQAG